MYDRVKEALASFYFTEIAALRKDNPFSEAQMHELSSPFLVSVPDTYLAADLKIMYVGKETNGWGGRNTFNDFIADLHGVEKMLQRYDHEITQEPRWNNRFFVEYKKIRKELCGNVRGSLLCNNLMKMDFKQDGKAYSRNSKDHSQHLLNFSKKLFVNELELLKPDFIIFATSHTYDSVLKKFIPNCDTIKVIEKKALWKFRSSGAVCYRTWHPQTIKYNSEKTISEYYQFIINDIKHETSKRQHTF
ncbi:hypothetical protein E4633_17100 [Geomonas terrae]|uniref:Uracil-DNA glycosylase-like domain-containing protein n=1 Tax=Geomonas terrae TaxID=2562681 RepID=A0A4S1CBI0_9BACT|nr:hypothetical protein [Geomonas terrae]TGU70715.1 hypothetical protein E4633_17100 [Geomonas terrae]